MSTSTAKKQKREPRQSKTSFRVSTKKTTPLFPANFLIILVCAALFPFSFGFFEVSLLGGVYGASISILSLLVVWLYGSYRDMELRRLQEDVFRKTAEDDRSQMEIAYKVELALRERAQDDLDVSNGVIDDLMNQINELSREAAKAKTKDALIEALQNRCESLNNEYHNKNFGRVTTLEDVKKLTGEA